MKIRRYLTPDPRQLALDFDSPRQVLRGVFSDRIKQVVSDAVRPLSGQELARLCGLTKKQCADALNTLRLKGKIVRTGRKFSARWSAPGRTQEEINHERAQEAGQLLHSCFNNFFRRVTP
jgi:hypothetical protein